MSPMRAGGIFQVVLPSQLLKLTGTINANSVTVTVTVIQ
jgi:hypothetical protein